jgi:hypothetical protein
LVARAAQKVQMPRERTAAGDGADTQKDGQNSRPSDSSGLLPGFRPI